MSRHILVAAVLLAGFSWSVDAQDDVPMAPERAAVTVQPAHRWTNLFAGKTAHLVCQVTSQVAEEATFTWSISVQRAVLARGQRPLMPRPGKPAEVTLDVDFPDVRPGLAVPAEMTLEVQTRTGLHARRTVNLHLFSPDVTANRQQWLRSLDITLFDPAKTTAAALDAVGIAYQFSDQPGGRTDRKGLLVQGSSIEPARQAAAWQAARAAAASGRKVLVLASAGGSIPLADLFGTDDPRATAASLRRSDLIRELDKRLDAAEWPSPGRLVASSVHLAARGDVPIAEFRDDSSGWTCLEIRYPNGGRLVWVGFGLIESWESTPAPRYLLLKLFERLTVETPDKGGLNHDGQ